MDIDRLKDLANVPKTGFVTNIEKATLENANFREVLFTGPHLQLVVMSLKPGEDIGLETHTKSDQFIRVESGTGQFHINGQVHECRDGSSIVIPQGSQHNVVNTGKDDMKIYTIYSSQEHKPGVKQKTKKDVE